MVNISPIFDSENFVSCVFGGTYTAFQKQIKYMHDYCPHAAICDPLIITHLQCIVAVCVARREQHALRVMREAQQTDAARLAKDALFGTVCASM